MRTIWLVVLVLLAAPAVAADYPAPSESSWVVRDFRFHTGETLPELRLHYTTVGAPGGARVGAAERAAREVTVSAARESRG